MISEINYEILASRKGTVTAKLTKGDKGIYLHSKYDPIKEAETFADNIYSGDAETFLVLGLALGHHVQALSKKLSPGQQIIVLENNENLYRLAEGKGLYDGLKANPQVIIHKVFSLHDYIRDFKKIIDGESVKLVVYGPALESFPEEFKEVKELIEEYRVKEQSMTSFLPTMLANFYENIKHYQYSVDRLFGKYVNQPIVIVAAGPSLDKNVHLLKDMGDKCVIIAVGRAVRSIVKAEVEPDFIVASDAKGHTHKQFVAIEKIKDLPVIGLSTTDANIFVKHDGLKYIALQEGLDEAEAYAREKGYSLVEAGGSVATTAFDIAIKMGGNPVIFIGQDLAYTGGQTHASGTWHRKVGDMPNLREVSGYYGGLVATNTTLNMYLRWFENRIRAAKEVDKEINFIDATEGGARIEGTEIMSLQAVIDKYMQHK